MRLLADEDLSPDLARIGQAAGYGTTCVRDRGRLHSSDASIARLAMGQERVLVTNNISDYLKLTERHGAHPGLIHLPLGSAADEARWLRAALAYIEQNYQEQATSRAEFMINRVIEVSRGGECREYEWPT